MDDHPILANSSPNTPSISSHGIKEVPQAPKKEEKKEAKVRGSWLQILLRAKYFKVAMTVFMMFLIFGMALLIAFRTSGPEKPVSAVNIGIVPEAVIVFPEIEEVEISTQFSETIKDASPTPLAI